jgi:hypothetical protein
MDTGKDQLLRKLLSDKYRTECIAFFPTRVNKAIPGQWNPLPFP